MKKKIILAMLIASLITFSSSCGGSNSIPDGMSEETYKVGVQALEIMDKYNNADISADEADQHLSDLYDKLDSLEFEEPDPDSYSLSDEDSALIIQIDIASFQYSIGPVGEDSDSSNPYSVADDLREFLELE